MSRSLKKGLFVDYKLAKKVAALSSEDRTVIKTWARSSTISPEMVGRTIAVHNGKAVGFTGPIHVQESGRGYFAGIGVHSEYRKYGLGKALFSTLCKSLKEIGAGYMTLFTGETNPARYIYQSAGFKIVKTWSDMDKIIKK